ncbi:TrmH family RNA methyltransferase [Maribacter hydrothermalis]|uniref:RNA methyltransferase n=1 Tax=Maribacter hydrothermalis TaxID=1836467 RepID=A0A1B7ZE24_9FLAO|nr:RNA methyltransferase [Maribacter hydrothermalis]APQ16538.1 RNA methyltransferase [Maribacter hydrothermalis]OBR41556.1 RNA methyltransferase [Maribacter hydrothermalis]
MVVKSELKLIKSLQQKKCRIEHGLFVVEGKKTIEEVVNSTIKLHKIFAVDSNGLVLKGVKVDKITTKELNQISSLKNPNGYLGVFYIPEKLDQIYSNWILVLDGVQDPGNLGTIIRLCDWFGITDLVCSKDTVDCYNPKVLQATMGSITRVNIHYLDLESYLNATKLPVYGTFMDGVTINKSKLPDKGIMVMGNEGKGISDTVTKLCSYKLTIPQFGGVTTESLNVASATAILLHEIRK